MKKLFFFASTAAVLATACTDDLGLKNNQGGLMAEGNTRIVATMSIDEGTRTFLENDADKTYKWSPGDAIGVYNAGEEGVTAVGFRYGQTTADGAAQFYGNLLDIPGEGDLYYAVYPYPTGTITEGQITMTVPASQQYDRAQAADPSKWQFGNLTGSFNQFMAPAVAYGLASTAEDGMPQFSMKFTPMVNYLVFPFQTFVDMTVSTVELSIEGEKLSGDFTVALDKVKTGNYAGAANPISSSDNTSIILNCGQGLTLNAGQGTNFWFVVPANLDLANAAITFQVNASNAEGPIDDPKLTFTKTLSPYAPVLGVNKVQPVYSLTNEAWTYTGTSAIVLTTQAQFIEYAYLVTNGNQAIYEWLESNEAGYDMSYSMLPNMVNTYDDANPNGNPSRSWNDLVLKFKEGGITDASDIAYYLAFNNNTNNAIKYPVKSAVLVKEIIFNPQTLSTELGLTLNTTIAPYYQKVYLDYVTNNGIPTIGGGSFEGTYTNRGNIYSISGLGTQPVSLTGLTINSTDNNGLFQGTGAPEGQTAVSFGTLQNINLNNLKVNVGETIDNKVVYALLAAPSYSNFNGVTVSGISDVVYGAACTSVPTTNKALFRADYSTWYNWNIGANGSVEYTNYSTGVVNNSTNNINLFAGSLNVTSNTENPKPEFYFAAKGHGVNNYANINIVGNDSYTRNGWGAVLTIPDASSASANNEPAAAELINKISNGANYNVKTAYSVVDSKTSYWTGTAASAIPALQPWVPQGTAEQLAALVQSGKGGEFEFTTYNLDLMGSYVPELNKAENANTVPAYWYAAKNAGNGTTAVEISTNKVANSITNVYINGTNPGQTGPTKMFTLFGYDAIVNGSLSISNVTAVPSGSGVYIAAVAATTSATETQDITVTGYQVPADAWDEVSQLGDQANGSWPNRLNGAGGLYQFINSGDQVAYLVGSKYSGYVVPTKPWQAGVAAGVLNLKLVGGSEGYVLENPNVGGTTNQEFGIVNVSFPPNDENNMSTVILYLNGFEADNFKTWNYAPVESNWTLKVITTINGKETTYINTAERNIYGTYQFLQNNWIGGDN